MKVRNNSQITWQSSLRSYSVNSRNSTSAESGSSKSTPTKKATTPTKRQVSTDVQTPYVALLQIKSSKQRVFSAPLASKQAQKLPGQMQGKDVKPLRSFIASMTAQKNQYQYLPIRPKASDQSSSIIRYTSSQSLHYRSINVSSVDSFSALNASLRSNSSNPFATGARLMPVQAKTGVFGNSTAASSDEKIRNIISLRERKNNPDVMGAIYKQVARVKLARLRPDSAPVHKQDFNKRRFFPKGILKDDNGAAVKQDQSRLAHLATPKSLPYRNCMFGTDQQNKPVTSYSVGKQNHCI